MTGQTQPPPAGGRAAAVGTAALYAAVVLIFVAVRLLPATGGFRPLYLFAARYTSIVLRVLAFLAFAALWNAAGETLITKGRLNTALRASPMRSLFNALLLGPFTGPGRMLRAPLQAAGRTTGTGSTPVPAAFPTEPRESSLFSKHPSASVALLLSATALHPAQLLALAWFFRGSTGAVILGIGFAVFVLLGVAVLLELMVAGGPLAPPGADNASVPEDARENPDRRRLETNAAPPAGRLSRFAGIASAELYHGLRVFILAALVALALHMAIPLWTSQWLHANPQAAMLLLAATAVVLSPPVGGAAAVAILYRGQAPLAAVIAFVLAAFTIRGGNLIALKRLLGARMAAITTALVILLIAVLLLPVADLLSGAQL